jgi:hypothetical protein
MIRKWEEGATDMNGSESFFAGTWSNDLLRKKGGCDFLDIATHRLIEVKKCTNSGLRYTQAEEMCSIKGPDRPLLVFVDKKKMRYLVFELKTVRYLEEEPKEQKMPESAEPARIPKIPKTTPKRRRLVALAAKVTSEEYESFSKSAEELGVTKSVLLRAIIKEAVESDDWDSGTPDFAERVMKRVKEREEVKV